MALGAASYKLALDAGDIKAGAEDARKAFRSVQSTFASLESPVEKLQRRLAAAEKAQQSFVAGTETYKRAASNVAKLRDEIEKLNATPVDSGKMRADMENVGKEVAGRLPVIGRYTSMIGSIHPAAIGAAAGIAAIGAALLAAKRAGEFVFDRVVEQLNAVDATSKAARQTGFDFATFAAIGRVGELADIKNVSGALETFTKNVGLAAMNTGKAQEAIKALGLDARALAQMDGRDRLKLVADRLAGVSSLAERTALAVRLFGEEGGKMAEVLAAGGSSIDAAVSDLDRFRLAVSDTEALGVEAAMDAAKDVSLSIAGIFRTIAVEIGPQAKVAADMLTVALQGEYGSEVIAGIKLTLDAIVVSVATWLSIQDKIVSSLLIVEASQKRLTGQFDAAAALEQEAMKRSLSSPYSILSQFYADAERARSEAANKAISQSLSGRGARGVIDSKAEEEERKSREKEEADARRDEDRANKSAADKLAAMELERQMFGRTSKEIAREREAREMERAGVNQYLIDRFRAAAAELDAMEAKKKATEEADRAARESQRKREAEEKRIADEEKRRREQMFRAARQAATATDPESQYRESLKQYVEWLKEKAISLDEFARLKEKAAEKLAKPIKIGTADAGVRGIQKGSAEAVELAWRLRQQREKTGTVNERQAQIDKELADREDAKQYFGAMIAADKARSDAEAAAIAESDKQVAAGTDALSALGIDRAGVDMLADSANEMWRQSAQAAGITSQARTADGPKTVEILADIRTALTNQETIEVTEVSSL